MKKEYISPSLLTISALEDNYCAEGNVSGLKEPAGFDGNSDELFDGDFD